MKRRRLTKLFLVLFVSLLSARLPGATVYVSGQTVGQGFTRARGPECFVVTAAHVVGSHPTVDLVTSAGVRGTANIEMNLAQDVSILRVNGQASAFCPSDQEWKIGLTTEVVPNAVQNWRLEMTDEAGTVQSVSMEQVAFDPQYIFIKGANGAAIQQTMSGSPVRADGRLAGILVNVQRAADGGLQGQVFRLPYVDSLLQGLFRAPSGIVQELTVAELEKVDQNIALAKVALDHNDCGIAIEALNGVPKQGQAAIWALYMARAYECTAKSSQSNPAKALAFYTQYDQLVPGQRDILEKLANLGYAVKKQAEVESLKRDLGGYWELSSGDILLIRTDPDGMSVHGYYAYLTLDSNQKFKSRHVGDPAFEGILQNGTVTGYSYQRWSDARFGDCEQQVPLTRGVMNKRMRLVLDDKAAVLQGQQENEILSLSECTQRTETTNVQLTRLGNDGVGSNHQKVQLGRDALLSAINERTRFAALRSNIAGQWQTPNDDVLMVSVSGKVATGTFTTISETTQRRVSIEVGGKLFQGRYENETFYGSIYMFTSEAVSHCPNRLGRGVDARIAMADDGSSLELYSFGNTINFSTCEFQDTDKQVLRLTRVTP